MAGTVLVTGAARRLGKTIALHLSEAGFNIAVHYNTSKDDAEKLCDVIRSSGRKAFAVYGDLSDPLIASKGLINATMRETTRLVGLVNSASTFEPDSFESLGETFYRRQMAVNAEAPLFLTHALHDAIDGPGWVVNLIDTKIDVLTPDFFSYTLSKMALENITRLTAQACAPKLRINAVAPGLVLRSGNQTQETFEREHDRIPLGVGPTAEHIAETVTFLAKVPSMTGQIVAVDGGRHFYTPSALVNEFEVPKGKEAENKEADSPAIKESPRSGGLSAALAAGRRKDGS